MALSSKGDLRSFESAELLITTAEECLAEYDRTMLPLRQVNAANIVSHIDPETGESVFKISAPKGVPAKARKLSSDAAANLRHALDQAICDAALDLGRPNAKNLYFPIGKSVSDFESQIKERCRNVHPALLDFCRAIEPYKHGKGEPLWILGKIAAPGKHQRVIRMTRVVESLIMNHTIISEPVKFVWIERDDEIEFARVGRGGNFKTDYRIAHQDVIDTEELGLSPGIKASLRDFLGITKSIVADLKAETERLLRAQGSRP